MDQEVGRPGFCSSERGGEIVHRKSRKAEPGRSSEREPADSFRDKSNIIGGWLPSLTFALVAASHAMKDITPKTRNEGQRGHVIHTRPWSSIVERYRELIALGHPVEPLLAVVEAIANSPVSTEVFGATSMADVLLSDCADF